MAPPSVPKANYTVVNDPISRKFGPESINYFSVSPLNRVSFLRTDNDWLIKAFSYPNTRFILFEDLGVLTKSPTELHYVEWADVQSLFGSSATVESVATQLFSKEAESERSKAFDVTTIPPLAIFLGLDPRVTGSGVSVHESFLGSPVFALDITARPPFAEASNALKESFESKELKFVKDRLNLSFEPEEAAIFAQARHLIDWHTRNPFCAGCGSRTSTVQAGWKRVCTSQTTPPCPTKATPHTISNLTFPRTDAVIITAIMNASGTHLLLGRQARFPKGMYSTLAGFLEPGESLEDAVRREVWEESGVMVGRVQLWGSQPWPYPANIMMGAIGVAVEGKDTIRLDLDKELEVAKWVPIQEVRESLTDLTPWGGIGASDGADSAKEKIRVPPRTAIAHMLLDAVCNGPILGGTGVKM